MKKTIFVFGIIMGGLLIGFMFYGAHQCYQNPGRETNTVLGYVGILLILSLIFAGIKNFRDRYNGGLITFGKAFKIGTLITLVATIMYVSTWLVDYYFFVPDFIDKYTQHVLIVAKREGADAHELARQAQKMAEFKESYKNPLFIIISTMMEIFPIGVVVALISAAILKRKTAKA